MLIKKILYQKMLRLQQILQQQNLNKCLYKYKVLHTFVTE